MIFGKKKPMPDTRGKDPSAGTAPKGAGVTADGGASVWVNKGNHLVESSMYADAIQCYDKALEINPGSVEVINNRGLALARTGRFGDAVQSYDRALELKPGDTEVLYNKGIALAQMGKMTEALACYDKLLEANPDDHNTWCSKGDVLFESEKYEDALKAYDMSIQLNPKDETAWNNRGMTLAKFNRYEEAIESYDKALEINPRIEKIWSNKGLAIAKMNEKQDKIDLQKIAVTLPKEEKTAPKAKPVLEEPAKNEKETEISFIQALMNIDRPTFEKPAEVRSENVPTTGTISDTSKSDISKNEEKQSLFGAGVFSEKTQPPVPKSDISRKDAPIPPKPAAAPLSQKTDENMKTGNSLYSNGKYEEALECFTKLLEKDPKNKTAWNNKGLSLGKLGRVYEAIGCYDKALEIAPKDQVVLNNKGSALFKKGRVNEALECYKTALGHDPNNKTASRGIELCNEYFAKSEIKS